MFVVVPHIVRSQELDEANLRMIDTGEGPSIDLRRADDGTAGAASAPAAQPTALQRPGVGTVPAQSAIEAAPTMLSQLRTDMAATGGPAATAQAAAPAANGNAMGSAQATAAQAAARPLAAAATANAATAGGGASFALNAPAGTVAPGSSFQVPVVLNGGTDVSSVALQLHYDATKMTLVNVANGDYLNRDGQAASLVHSDEPAGTLAIVTSRAPGTRGVGGTGVVCVLTFQAKASGASDLSMIRGSVVNSAQQQLPVANAQASIQVK